MNRGIESRFPAPFSRAGKDAEAMTAVEADAINSNGKALVALVHARAGRRDQARRWLNSLRDDLERAIRSGYASFGLLRTPQYWPFDVLRADLLRREAYASLGEQAPELLALRLMRGDALWRLDERRAGRERIDRRRGTRGRTR